MGDRRDWEPIVAKAAAFVEDLLPLGSMLRQAHYHLLGYAGYGEKPNDYDYLSEITAKARRNGEFPPLVDLGRAIHVAPCWASPEEALADLREQYRRDRTEGQRKTLYIGVEKVGLLALMDDWLGHLGIPILPMKGYASHSFLEEIVKDARERGRDSTVLEVGDFDASGEDIPRVFTKHTGLTVVRVALTHAQVTRHGLRGVPGKVHTDARRKGQATDTRWPKFASKYGFDIAEPWQWEVDELDPRRLHALIQTAINRRWNSAAYESALAQEEIDRRLL